MPKKDAAERLVEWRNEDVELRFWTVSQGEHLYVRTPGRPEICVTLIIRRWTKKSHRLVHDRGYFGWGMTFNEAVTEALKEAKGAGDA